jgi:hypothetical protein
MNDKGRVEMEFASGCMSQALADRIFGQIQAQAAEGKSWGDIVLKGVNFRDFPRLVVDYGELYDTLCEVAKEYRDYRREVEGRAGTLAVPKGFHAAVTPDTSEAPIGFFVSTKDATDLVLNMMSAPSWTCDNHAEPIHYTDGTEVCYCGHRGLVA